MNNLELKCTGYRIDRRVNDPVRLDVEFILNIHPRRTDEIAEALKCIERYLSEAVNLVKSADKPRCYYCGKLADDAETQCKACGANL